jgi:hypothetical protein
MQLNIEETLRYIDLLLISDTDKKELKIKCKLGGTRHFWIKLKEMNPNIAWSDMKTLVIELKDMDEYLKVNKDEYK